MSDLLYPAGNAGGTEHVDLQPVLGLLAGAAAWLRHQMETFSVLLALCAGNSPVNSPHKDQWRGAMMKHMVQIGRASHGLSFFFKIAYKEIWLYLLYPRQTPARLDRWRPYRWRLAHPHRTHSPSPLPYPVRQTCPRTKSAQVPWCLSQDPGTTALLNIIK